MMRNHTRSFWQRLLLAALLLLVLLPTTGAAAQTDRPRQALLLTLNGELTQPMLEYLNRGLQTAAARQAELVILQLNTPGGQVDLMNRMVQVMRASSVPVVVYVAPRGAIAGSAGTILTLAGHAAAMAPETAIGAASPVGGQGEDIGGTLERKIKEILKATARSLAERRGPEATALAEETIESARAVSATEALQAGLVDFVAEDVDDLLAQLDGFTVALESGERTLATTGLAVEPLGNTLIEQLLGMLVNPNIVFLLLTIGVQALIIELASPGGWVAGAIGVVCLALATYGLGILPVNWFGLTFIALAFVLFILDIKAPTHGALTVAGATSLVIGALVLFNTPLTPPTLRVSVPLVIGTAVAIALVFLTFLSFGLRALRIPARMGENAVVGRVGVARTEINPRGSVQVAGELWTAELDPGAAPVRPGQPVRVLAQVGLRLRVRGEETPAVGSPR